MKLKMMYISILLTVSSFVFAMEKKWFQMPEQAVLKKNLEEMNFNNLIQYTDLTKRLAEKEILPGSIIMIVDEEWESECKRIKTQRKDPKAVAIFNLNKPLVYRALLKDMPEALQQVQEFLKQAEELAQEMESEVRYNEEGISSDEESDFNFMPDSAFRPHDSDGD